MLELGPELARAGLATIGIDAVLHGRRGSSLELLKASPFAPATSSARRIADQMALLRAIESGIDVDGDGRADLDRDPHGLPRHLAGRPHRRDAGRRRGDPADVAVLNVAGGRVAFLGQSIGLRDLVGGSSPWRSGSTPPTRSSRPTCSACSRPASTRVDHRRRAELRAPLVPRSVPRRAPAPRPAAGGDRRPAGRQSSTEALAAAGGWSANTPMRDPGGVSGLWRFDPPGGHGILGRDDVRAQAFRFLVSDGTRSSTRRPERAPAALAAGQRDRGCAPAPLRPRGRHAIAPAMGRVLIAGCGDVGTTLGLALAADGDQVLGLRRRPELLPAPIVPVRADLATGDGLAAAADGVTALVYAAAADGFSDDAYRERLRRRAAQRARRAAAAARAARARAVHVEHRGLRAERRRLGRRVVAYRAVRILRPPPARGRGAAARIGRSGERAAPGGHLRPRPDAPDRRGAHG